MRSLERSDSLVVAAVYEREIAASLERVWENVYDWAHLPWLHGEAFASIEALTSGAWGWHARVGLHGSAEIEIELVTEERAHRYVTRTLKGAGAPTEIWTQLDPLAKDRTGIRVEFCVRPVSEESLVAIGEGYVSLYTLLWTQDEGMMRERESALTARCAQSTDRDDLRPATLRLGHRDELLTRLPLMVELGGQRLRVLEVDGELFAHGVRCPHLLGPLEECTVDAGQIVCPWHGYRFDVKTGRSVDGRGLRLGAGARVETDSLTGEVTISAGY